MQALIFDMTSPANINNFCRMLEDIAAIDDNVSKLFPDLKAIGDACASKENINNSPMIKLGKDMYALWSVLIAIRDGRGDVPKTEEKRTILIEQKLIPIRSGINKSFNYLKL